MSTKCTIKYGDGFHIYEEAHDFGDESKPIHLALEGVGVADLATLREGFYGVEVTLIIPRALARAIGLPAERQPAKA